MQGKAPLLLAAFLTWLAGFVDAAGYISLGHIYTANMSGNSVAIGIHSVSGEVAATLRRIWPVVTYFAGLLFCRLLITYGARRRIRRVATLAVCCEIVLLLPVCLITGSAHQVGIELSIAYIGLLALAMGIQNAALTHFSTLTVHTGFVTGTLLKCAEHGAKYLTWFWDEAHQGSIWRAVRNSGSEKSFRLTVWLAAIWCAYVVGACCGAFGNHSVGLRSLWIPIAGLIAVIAADLKKPLAGKEEEQQAKGSG